MADLSGFPSVIWITGIALADLDERSIENVAHCSMLTFDLG